MLSSESVAFQQLGYLNSNIQDIKPGQVVVIQKGAEPVTASVECQKDIARISVSLLSQIVPYLFSIFAWKSLLNLLS